MSDPQQPPPSGPARPGWVTPLLLLIGVVLLLPGICAIILIGIDPHELVVDSMYLLLILVLLAIGAGGVAMIWAAIKWLRPR
jgi:hypothetical protein